MVDRRIAGALARITKHLDAATGGPLEGAFGSPYPEAPAAAATPYQGGPSAASPYAGGLTAANPYTGTLGASAPYQRQQRLGAASPYSGGMGAASPYGGGFGAASPYGGGGLQAQQPSYGGLQPTAYYTKGNTAAREAAKFKPGATPGARGGVAGGASTGYAAGVAPWAGQAQATFGDLGADLPDVMLAIMTNESGGDPNAYNSAGDAWGLFQNVGLGKASSDQQFAAARTLLQQKLTSIDAAYRANGLSPDERTRARDVALAWGGHFDYRTGQPNPSSADVGSGQTAAQLSEIFLRNYDAIKAGRQQQAAPGGTYAGAASGMSSIWGGQQAGINQEYGVVDPSVNQAIYGYGKDYGLPQGHTGLDVGLKRGSSLYMPAGMTGTVIERAPGYFRDEDYGDDGQSYDRGELRIQLANGDILIMGHTSQINVRPGDTVTGGQLVGLSGSAAGDHLHLEVRQRQQDGSYRLVNPHQYFGQ